jgi:hypothetical protein
MRMSRILAVGLALCVGGTVPALGSSAGIPVQIIAQDVEIAFREAMELWAYGEFWRLWEISSDESRSYYTQNGFATLMERGSARPAAGRRVEDLKVSVTSPQSAMVRARIGLEDPNTNTPQPIVRSFLFYHEVGRWRPQLSDFLGLSSSTFLAEPPFGAAIVIAPCCPPVHVLPPLLQKTSQPLLSVPRMILKR